MLSVVRFAFLCIDYRNRIYLVVAGVVYYLLQLGEEELLLAGVVEVAQINLVVEVLLLPSKIRSLGYILNLASSDFSVEASTFPLQAKGQLAHNQSLQGTSSRIVERAYFLP